MPRIARLVLPGLPLHVTQRGVNRAAIFVDDEDRRRYRSLLRKWCARHEVAVHAFVLMGNHVHLLMTPADTGSLALAMRKVGQMYAQGFNERHGRSGTLWQGRYGSCIVQTERYFLEVLRYIELNPVRAAMVASAETYPWSSVRVHLGQSHDPVVTLHEQYLALGRTAQERVETYRGWLLAGVSDERRDEIRKHLAQERVLGGDDFREKVGRTLGLQPSCRPRGRPKRP